MNLREQLSNQTITLVAVSKTYPSERILIEYAQGQRIFGENKVQELVGKHDALPKDIEWHFIGHLQRNKVKYIAPFIAVIHAVDSWELLLEINKQAEKNQRIIQVLLQFHIATESSKFGFSEPEANGMLTEQPWQSLTHVHIGGVMGMATFSEDETLVRKEFALLKSIFDRLKDQFFQHQATFKEVSMGMSGDWEIAAQQGSTLVRIGSLIFGNRAKT